MANSWDYWVEGALSKLESLKLLRSLRPIHLSPPSESCSSESNDFEFYEGLSQWDRASVEIEISEATFQKWLQDIPSSGKDNASLLLLLTSLIITGSFFFFFFFPSKKFCWSFIH